MNSIPAAVATGTFGELLVQLRLLQYDVQAAVPLKDSGNDLIAVRGDVFRAIQVKTTTGTRFDMRELPRHYHLVGLVALAIDGSEVDLHATQIFLLPRVLVEGRVTLAVDSLAAYCLNGALVDTLFGASPTAPVSPPCAG